MCCPKKFIPDTDPFYIKTLAFELEEKQFVVEQFAKIKRTLYPSMDAFKELFKVFNEHINEFPNDINCMDCQKAIRDFWRNSINHWQKAKLI